MSTFWRYVRVQLLVLLCGIVGPIFLVIYFVAGADPMLEWMFWTGLLITAADVLIALAITAYGSRSAAKTQELEASGALALAQVTGIHETNTRINDRPLVKLDLQISGPGITPFATQDQVVASVSRLPMITSRKLVALNDARCRSVTQVGGTNCTSPVACFARASAGVTHRWSTISPPSMVTSPSVPGGASVA